MTTELFFTGSPNLVPKPRDESTLDIPDLVSPSPAADHLSTTRADFRGVKSDSTGRAIGEAEIKAIVEAEAEIRSERVGDESRQAAAELETKPLRRQLGGHNAGGPMG